MKGLIEDFIGFKLVDQDESYYIPTEVRDAFKVLEIIDYPVNEAKFHLSWDWLMPIVEKIEMMEIDVPKSYKIGFMKNSTKAFVGISTGYADFNEGDEKEGWLFI